jgi:hypothetical protein
MPGCDGQFFPDSVGRWLVLPTSSLPSPSPAAAHAFFLFFEEVLLISGANQGGCFFGDHKDGGVGVSADEFGHDGGVCDAEGFDAVDAQLCVYDGLGVVAHFAGAGGVVEGF